MHVSPNFFRADLEEACLSAPWTSSHTRCMQMNRHLLAQTGACRVWEGHRVWMARTPSIPARSPAASDHIILLVLPLPDLSNGLLSVGGSNAVSIACNLSRPRHHRLSFRLTDYGHSRPPLCLRRPADDPGEIIIA